MSILLVNKAIGLDLISHKILKSTEHSVVKPLYFLFNRSLSENIFHNSWKIVHVLPLFKCSMPVSLLSCVSKVMERVIFKYLYNYFHKHDLFYKCQAGFLQCHSTVYQLLETYHSIVQTKDDGKYCCMIFCDLSKAFDKV